MRRIVSRLLLVALAILGIVAAVRFADGDSSAAVWMDDPKVDRLRHDRFEVLRPVDVAVAAAGSFEDTGDALATEVWITDADGAVVWRMAPRRGEGTFVTVADTFELAPGRYDAYFASFGTGAVAAPRGDGMMDRLRHALTRGAAWRGEAARWRLRVGAARADDRDALDALSGTDHDRAARGAVWTSGPLGNSDTATELLLAADSVQLTLRAVLEASPKGARDRASLVRLDDAAPDTVWTFSYQDSEPAGGAARNRRADAVLSLEPGLYRVTVTTDARHAYSDWSATPPDAPWMWGLTLLGSDPDGALTSLQPSNDFALPVVAAFDCVGTSEKLEDTFTLGATTEVVVTGAGELFEGERSYDWGWLDRVESGGGTRRLWELTREDSVPAGGDDKNRMALDVLTLQPGTYTLGYESDGSHDCHDFNSDPPADPDFWGVSVFALSSSFDPASVQRTTPAPQPAPPGGDSDDGADSDDGDTSDDDDDDAPTPPIAALERVALGADEATGFEAPTSGRVLVSAHSRTAPDAPQAYGWIEDADGVSVWSTRDDEHAGKGYVMDFLELTPGARYTLRYHADPEPSEAAFEIRSIRVVPLGG